MSVCPDWFVTTPARVATAPKEPVFAATFPEALPVSKRSVRVPVNPPTGKNRVNDPEATVGDADERIVSVSV